MLIIRITTTMKHVNVTKQFCQNSPRNHSTIPSYKKVKLKPFFSWLRILLLDNVVFKTFQIKKTLFCNFRHFIAIHVLKPRNKYSSLTHFLISSLVMCSKLFSSLSMTQFSPCIGFPHLMRKSLKLLALLELDSPSTVKISLVFLNDSNYHHNTLLLQIEHKINIVFKNIVLVLF